MTSQETVADVEALRGEVADLGQTLKETVEALVALKGVIEGKVGGSYLDNFAYMKIDELRRKF